MYEHFYSNAKIKLHYWNDFVYILFGMCVMNCVHFSINKEKHTHTHTIHFRNKMRIYSDLINLS